MSERNMLSRVGAVELGMGHGEEIFGVFGWVAAMSSGKIACGSATGWTGRGESGDWGAKECLGTAQVLEEAGENERLFFFGGLVVQQMLQALRDRGKRQDLFRHDGTRRQALVPRFEHWCGPQELALVHLVAKAIVRGWS